MYKEHLNYKHNEVLVDTERHPHLLHFGRNLNCLYNENCNLRNLIDETVKEHKACSPEHKCDCDKNKANGFY